MSGWDRWRELAEPSWAAEPTHEWRPQFPGQRYPGDIGIENLTPPPAPRGRAAVVGRAEVHPVNPPPGRDAYPVSPAPADRNGAYPGPGERPAYPDGRGRDEPRPGERRPWADRHAPDDVRADQSPRRGFAPHQGDRYDPRGQDRTPDRARSAGWPEDRHDPRWVRPEPGRRMPAPDGDSRRPVSPAPEPGWLPEPEEFPHRPQPRPARSEQHRGTPEGPPSAVPRGPVDRRDPGFDRPVERREPGFDGAPRRDSDPRREAAAHAGNPMPAPPTAPDGHRRPVDPYRAEPGRPGGPRPGAHGPDERWDGRRLPSDSAHPRAEEWPPVERRPRSEPAGYRPDEWHRPTGPDRPGPDGRPARPAEAGPVRPDTGWPRPEAPNARTRPDDVRDRPAASAPRPDGLRERPPVPAAPRPEDRRPPAYAAPEDMRERPAAYAADDRRERATSPAPTPPVSAPPASTPPRPPVPESMAVPAPQTRPVDAPASAPPAGPVSAPPAAPASTGPAGGVPEPVSPPSMVEAGSDPGAAETARPVRPDDNPAVTHSAGRPAGGMDAWFRPNGPVADPPGETEARPAAHDEPLPVPPAGQGAAGQPISAAPPAPVSGSPASAPPRVGDERGGDERGGEPRPPVHVPADAEPATGPIPPTDEDDPPTADRPTAGAPTAPPAGGPATASDAMSAAPVFPIQDPGPAAPPVSAPPAPVSAPPGSAPPVSAPPAPSPSSVSAPPAPPAYTPPPVSAPPAYAPAQVSAPPAQISAPPAQVSAPPAQVSAPPAQVSAPPAQVSAPPAPAAPAEDEPREVRPADPEQALAAVRWRLHPEKLREEAPDPEALRAILDGLTTKLGSALDNRTRARLLSLRSVAARILGDLDDAVADARLALTYAEATGELRRTALARARLAEVLRWRGEHAEADRLFAEANSSELPDRLRAVLHEHAGRSCYDQGRLVEACLHFERALDLRQGEDAELNARTVVALDAVAERAGADGFGPKPRTRETILGEQRHPAPTFDDEQQLWGYADAEGELVIEHRYAEVQPFREGLAWVRRPEASRWALIDPAGVTLIEANNGYRAVGSFSEELAWVSMDGKGRWMAVDPTNIVRIPPGYEDVRPFRGGLAVVRQNGGWGAVDRTGQVVVPTRYHGFTTTLADGRYVDGFTEEGLAVVELAGRRGVVDRTGRVLVEPAYSALVVHPVAFLVGDESGRWGALDRRGEPLIARAHPSRAAVVAEIEHLLADTSPVL
ncbi:WG repeat-containing protein [Micromonospora sp. NPDC006766]|uniref:WG repeat-containing protein n=1 Tax=Micromonospora sp. NPDC006766 TaxID=3154778 RepID=UPI0033FE38B5